jgi:hypothetical protein
MKKFLSLWLILFTIQCNTASLEEAKPETCSFGGIKEIEKDHLYVGAVADDFHVAMERITDENAKMWKEYAASQYYKIRCSKPLKYLPIVGGCGHFERVLDSADILMKNNELWVAYASNKEITQKAKLSIPSGQFVSDPHIEMYVSVLIPSRAPVTAHMGISRTWEAAIDFQKKSTKRKKHPDQSVHLHSFAAQVSKLRDPKKVFMLTAPVEAMRTILIKKMPSGSVFIGDSDYQKEVEGYAQNPMSCLGEYDLQSEENETEAEKKTRLEKIAVRRNKTFKIADKMSLLKTHPPRVKQIDDKDTTKLTIFNADGLPLVTLDKSNLEDYWAFMSIYQPGSLLSPYALVDLGVLGKAKPLS